MKTKKLKKNKKNKSPRINQLDEELVGTGISPKQFKNFDDALTMALHRRGIDGSLNE